MAHNAEILYLMGFVKGIICDEEISEAEVLTLKQWLDNHTYLSDNKLYVSIKEEVDKILADGILTEDEKIELLFLLNDVWKLFAIGFKKGAKTPSIKLNQTDAGIYYLHDYYPKNKFPHPHPKDKEMRERIWAFKDKELKAIEFFSRELTGAIASIKEDFIFKRVWLVSVPPSKAGKVSAVRKSIDYILFSDSLQGLGIEFYNGGSLLERTVSVPKKHLGGAHDYNMEKESISCGKNDLYKLNADFLIIDDITTSGFSMDVCSDILVENKANSDMIHRMAIAKTVG